jgi:sugar lactone lactonase YvrE
MIAGSRLGMVLFALLLAGAAPAGAWDRGTVETFAALPAFAPNGGACPGGAATCASGVEGVAVAPDGTIYVPSFGFNKDGALTGNGELFVLAPDGRVIRHFPVLGSSPHLIGGIYQPSSKSVLIPDLALGVVWKVDPVTRSSSVFLTAPTVTATPGLNAMAFDRAGNVYVSDSFQGAIWKTGPDGGAPSAWYAPFNPGQNDLLLPTANAGEVLIPPFGANGITFNREGTALFVNNTAYHSIVEIPVNPDGSAGAAQTFTTGINAPDGIALGRDDNLWVLANQGDEVVVVDPRGKVVAKKGDFDGIAEDGTIRGLLFPASDAFSPDGRYLYVTNLALYLPYAGVPSIAVDSGWTLQVRQYNLARIRIAE